MWVRFKLDHAMDVSTAAHFVALAGPRFNFSRTEIRAHLNCAWLVKNGLDSLLVRYRLDGPLKAPAPLSAAAALAAPELRPLAKDYVARTPYQLRGLCKVAAWPRGGSLWWPTGAGKTLASLAWALLSPLPIVLVTRGGAKRQMQDEIWKYSTIEAGILEGREATAELVMPGRGKRLQLDPSKPPRVIITGWEVLGDQLEIIERLGQISVIADEAHRGKSGKRWKNSVRADGKPEFEVRGNIAGAIFKLSRQATRMLSTTASAQANERLDLWAQLDHMDPDAWGNRRAFGFRYCGAEKAEHGGEHAWKSGRDTNTDELNTRMYSWSGIDLVSPAEQARDLPAKRRMTTYVPVSAQVKVIPGFTKLLKKAAGEGEEAITSVRLMLAAAKKRPAVIAQIGEYLASKFKILIFTGRVEDSDELYAALQKKYPGVKGWLATGALSMEQRHQIQLEYMGDSKSDDVARATPHPGACYIVATIQCFGESLNLQDSDVELFVMLPWTVRELIQAEGRGYRLGMSRPLLAHYMVAEGTYDEHVAETIINKLESVERVMGATTVSGLGDQLAGVEDAGTLIDSLVAKILARNSVEGDSL